MFMKFFWAMPLRDVSCDFAISSNSDKNDEILR